MSFVKAPCIIENPTFYVLSNKGHNRLKSHIKIRGVGSNLTSLMMVVRGAGSNITYSYIFNDGSERGGVTYLLRTDWIQSSLSTVTSLHRLLVLHYHSNREHSSTLTITLATVCSVYTYRIYLHTRAKLFYTCT